VTIRHLVISYDVTDDRRRERLSRFLRGYAERVQKSVFEGVVPERVVERLRGGITKTIDHGGDSVRLYTLCRRCREATEVIGTGVYIAHDEDADVLL
jgi:CRISPR-associated protein Cas2